MVANSIQTALPPQHIKISSRESLNYKFRAGWGGACGLCVEKSKEEVVGMVGILRSGHAYIPLDPQLPTSRLNFLARQCDCELVLAQRRFQTAMQHITVLILEDLPSRGKVGTTSTPTVLPELLAYVLFTSGSTGKPKGVMVPHSSLVAHVHTTCSAVPLHPQSTVLYTPNYTFDPSVYLVWCTLCSAAELCIPRPRAWANPPARLMLLMFKQAISFTEISPAVFSMCISSQDDLTSTPRVLSLRTVYLGGEKLSNELVGTIRQKHPHVQVYNSYGPTEVTIFSNQFRAIQSEPTMSVPIGQPTPNVSCHVLDANSSHSHVPVGVPGMLYLGGPTPRIQLVIERFTIGIFYG